MQALHKDSSHPGKDLHVSPVNKGGREKEMKPRVDFSSSERFWLLSLPPPPLHCTFFNNGELSFSSLQKPSLTLPLSFPRLFPLPLAFGLPFEASHCALFVSLSLSSHPLLHRHQHAL
jgi:hypothetical protein